MWMLVSKTTLTPLEFAVFMNDTVQVCRFDAEPLGPLGTVACQSIGFFQQNSLQGRIIVESDDRVPWL
jgi:hypothetical protein